MRDMYRVARSTIALKMNIRHMNFFIFVPSIYVPPTAIMLFAWTRS